VAPAKQRLSSFRATSEQQLQLLGRGSPQRGKATSEQAAQSRPQDQHFPAQAHPQQQDSDGISQPVDPMRRQLPPKPTSLSIFNGPAPSVGDRPLVPRKSDFKADLDAKIRRQKQKVKQQLQQQQQQQQQQSPQPQQAPQEPQHSPQSPQTRNCNVSNNPANPHHANSITNANATANLKPCITPRPASLSGSFRFDF